MDKDKTNGRMNRMGEMPIGRLIITMSWPAVLSMFIQAFYNVVDSFFVSRISEQALAAVTYIFPVQMLIISVAVGTGVGINSLISRRLGAQRFEEADMAASHGYRLSFFNWILFALIGLFLSHPMMAFLSPTPYIVDSGASYMAIITIGSLFIMVQVSAEKILQATGNMLLPMACSIIGAVTNIIFDPLLIFGIGPFPEMGVTGAAVATVFGQFLSMCLGQILLFKGKHPVRVKLFGWKFQGRIIRDIYAVGAPAILMQSIASVMQFGMNIILGGLSETAVAVLGVYGRLQSFIFMPVFGLNQGVLPIMGYNYGARNRKRLMETFKKGLTIAFIIMAMGLVIFQLFPEELLGLFNSKGSQDMYNIGIPALKIISLCFLPASFGIMASSIFQAMGHGFYSLWGALLRQLVGILPLAWIFARISGVSLVWYSFPLAEIIGTIYFAVALKHIYKIEIRRLDIMEENTY
ncbi:MAG: MATE family efflux transporter [Clostridiales bacterium]|nr:MATE family efflux transporter [Clostridiales bacterium]